MIAWTMVEAAEMLRKTSISEVTWKEHCPASQMIQVLVLPLL